MGCIADRISDPSLGMGPRGLKWILLGSYKIVWHLVAGHLSHHGTCDDLDDSFHLGFLLLGIALQCFDLRLHLSMSAIHDPDCKGT